MSLSIQAQSEFIVNLKLYGDSTIVHKTRWGDWHGKNVACRIMVKNPEDNTGIFSVGGSDPDITSITGVTDFSYYTGWANNPVTIDTSGTIIKPNSDSTWWGIGYNNVKGFPFPLPAIKYEANTCDSVEVYIKYIVTKLNE